MISEKLQFTRDRSLAAGDAITTEPCDVPFCSQLFSASLHRPPTPHCQLQDFLVFSDTQLATDDTRKKLVQALHSHHHRGAGGRKLLYIHMPTRSRAAADETGWLKNNCDPRSPNFNFCLLQAGVGAGVHNCNRVAILLQNVAISRFSSYRSSTYGSVHLTISPEIQTFFNAVHEQFFVSASASDDVKVRCENDSNGCPRWTTEEVFYTFPDQQQSFEHTNKSSAIVSHSHDSLPPNAVPPSEQQQAVLSSSSSGRAGYWTGPQSKAARCSEDESQQAAPSVMFRSAVDESRQGEEEEEEEEEEDLDFAAAVKPQSKNIPTRIKKWGTDVLISRDSSHWPPYDHGEQSSSASSVPTATAADISTKNSRGFNALGEPILPLGAKIVSREELMCPPSSTNDNSNMLGFLKNRCDINETRVDAIVHLGYVCPYQQANSLILFLRKLRIIKPIPFVLHRPLPPLLTSFPTLDSRSSTDPRLLCRSSHALTAYVAASIHLADQQQQDQQQQQTSSVIRKRFSYSFAASTTPPPLSTRKLSTASASSCLPPPIDHNNNHAVAATVVQPIPRTINKRVLQTTQSINVAPRWTSGWNSTAPSGESSERTMKSGAWSSSTHTAPTTTSVAATDFSQVNDPDPAGQHSSMLFEADRVTTAAAAAQYLHHPQQHQRQALVTSGTADHHHRQTSQSAATEDPQQPQLFSANPASYSPTLSTPADQSSPATPSLFHIPDLQPCHPSTVVEGSLLDELHPTNVKRSIREELRRQQQQQKKSTDYIAQTSPPEWPSSSSTGAISTNGITDGMLHVAAHDVNTTSSDATSLRKLTTTDPGSTCNFRHPTPEREVTSPDSLSECLLSHLDDRGDPLMELNNSPIADAVAADCLFTSGLIYPDSPTYCCTVGDLVEISKLNDRKDILENQRGEVIKIVPSPLCPCVSVVLCRGDGTRYQSRRSHAIREDVPLNALRLIERAEQRSSPTTVPTGLFCPHPKSICPTPSELWQQQHLVSAPFSMKPPWSTGALCFFWDLEATGLHVGEDDITQIACICRRFHFADTVDNNSSSFGTWEVVPGCPQAEFNCYVYTDREIPSAVVELTGITNHFLDKHGVPLERAVADWSAWVMSVRRRYRSCPVWFVAHNGNRYDLPLLFQQEFRKLGQMPGSFLKSVGVEAIVDSVVLSRRLVWGEVCRSHKLQSLFKDVFKAEMPNEHDALGDVTGLARLMEREPFLSAWTTEAVGWSLAEYMVVVTTIQQQAIWGSDLLAADTLPDSGMFDHQHNSGAGPRYDASGTFDPGGSYPPQYTTTLSDHSAWYSHPSAEDASMAAGATANMSYLDYDPNMLNGSQQSMYHLDTDYSSPPLLSVANVHGLYMNHQTEAAGGSYVDAVDNVTGQWQSGSRETSPQQPYANEFLQPLDRHLLSVSSSRETVRSSIAGAAASGISRQARYPSSPPSMSQPDAAAANQKDTADQTRRRLSSGNSNPRGTAAPSPLSNFPPLAAASRFRSSTVSSGNAAAAAAAVPPENKKADSGGPPAAVEKTVLSWRQKENDSTHQEVDDVTTSPTSWTSRPVSRAENFVGVPWEPVRCKTIQGTLFDGGCSTLQPLSSSSSASSPRFREWSQQGGSVSLDNRPKQQQQQQQLSIKHLIKQSPRAVLAYSPRVTEQRRVPLFRKSEESSTTMSQQQQPFATEKQWNRSGLSGGNRSDNRQQKGSPDLFGFSAANSSFKQRVLPTPSSSSIREGLTEDWSTTPTKCHHPVSPVLGYHNNSSDSAQSITLLQKHPRDLRGVGPFEDGPVRLIKRKPRHSLPNPNPAPIDSPQRPPRRSGPLKKNVKILRRPPAAEADGKIQLAAAIAGLVFDDHTESTLTRLNALKTDTTVAATTANENHSTRRTSECSQKRLCDNE